MYEVSDQLYLEVADRLRSRFGDGDYFSGMLEFEHDQTVCHMLLSAVVYHHTHRREEGDVRLISDVVPVWWEFHTTLPQGEVLNDFSFNTLREYLKQEL